jgi:hypothetical protein
MPRRARYLELRKSKMEIDIRLTIYHGCAISRILRVRSQPFGCLREGIDRKKMPPMPRWVRRADGLAVDDG